MHYWKTFKNHWTLELNLCLKRPTGLNIDLNWYGGLCHPGLYMFFNIFGVSLGIEFYGPDIFCRE